MEMNKIVNLDTEELASQAHQAAEQIFRLRFQMRMGQNEGLKKLRELKKDVARIKTVQRQRELGIAAPQAATEAKPKRKRAAKKSTKTRAKAAKGGKNLKKTTRKSVKAGGKTKAGSSRAKTVKHGKANAKKGS